jgi:hypothetical protein
LLEADEFEEMVDLQLIRQPVVRDRRADLIHSMGNAEFKRQFRFTKEAVVALTEMLGDQLSVPDQRGGPLTALQKVLITLNHYAGGHFQRTSALCSGVSQPTTSRVVKKVTAAICEHKRYYLKMPSETELMETAGNMAERFYLPRFGYAVDGMLARFDHAPRDIPQIPGRPLRKQDFFCRKGFYAMNCQVVCNDKFLILDLDCDWPGITHDARVWSYSTVRRYLETIPGYFLLAADSAYPISPVVMKPYTNREAGEDDTKRLFNFRLSALRTVMSENVFGIWKRRFPVLRMLRAFYLTSKDIILATAILHNLAVKFGEVDPEEDEEVLDLLRDVIDRMDAPDVEAARVVEQRAIDAAREAGVPAVIDPVKRAQGQAIRDELRANMPPGRARN